MVDICISIAAKLAEYTVAPVLRQFGYLIYYKSNVEDLTQKVTTLTATRDGVQRLVERVNRNSEIILPQVNDWLDRVEKTLQEKEKCFEKEGVAKATTCWCPNLKVRHSLSRKATKMAPKVDGLLTEGNFTTISCPAPAPKIEYPCIPYYEEDSTEALAKQPHEGAIASSSSGASNPTNPPAPMDLSERLEYRLPYTRDLLKALQDDKINMIGISGIFREIDTVSTKEFIKRMKHRNLFEEVVMAVVSQQDPDLKRIQGEIADMLHLKLEDGSLVEPAERLRAAMSAILDSKRLLLILADVRQVLDLESIGISSGDGNKRCKIILISQLPNLFGEMTTHTNFELLLPSTPVARAVEFESRISVMRDVMDALTDDESNPIVLCGMGGIGKTTLVMEIGAKASEVDLFGDVAFAEFTQEPDLVKIQGKIAKALGLELKADDDRDERADKLRKRISGGTKRILVILDNVWTNNSSPDQLTLWEVGIPISRDLKCCKVLVSSREQDIFREMKTKKNLSIGGLPQKDAWSLFKKVAGKEVAGRSIECDPELRLIAEQVLKECDGLPVAITTVGRALQGKSIPNWRDALTQLRKACPEDVPRVIKDVYGKIELSYDYLPSEQAKSCLLLCCVFPESESFPVEILFRMAFGLGLFKGIDSIAEGRDHIKTLVDTLKSRFLLLNSDKEDGEEMVKMHDVVRDAAVYIASEELTQKKNDELKKRIVLRQRVELNGWPTNEESTYCTSLATSTGGLTELLLLIIESELELPATIFNGMEDLKVLLIKDSTLPSLPLLKNLQTLILEGCDLNLDAIGELRTLMILRLKGDGFKQLPDTFKNLSNLRLLDLRGCKKLKTIAPGVISSLSRLEELYMLGSFEDWVVEKLASRETTNWISQLEERGEPEEEVDMWKRFNRLAKRSEPDLGELYRKEVKNSNRKDEHTKWANSMDWTVGILSELLFLSRLSTLQVVLPPVDILLRTSCKLFHKLERFKISIGWEHKRLRAIVGYENHLRVADLDASSLAGTGITLLLKKTNALELKLKNLTDPLDVFYTDQYCCGNLKFLGLEECDALEYLIDMTSLTEHTPRSIFPVLNYLLIKGASRLKEIFHGDLPQGLLQKLKALDIRGCQSLEAIFGLVGSGHHEEEAALEINFLSLTSLTLEDLPSFTRIRNSNYKGVARLPEVSSLYPNSLTVEHSLFFDPKVYFPVLRELRIKGLGNLKEIWNSQLSCQSFQNLTSLEVTGCHSLRYLFSLSIARGLVRLEELYFEDCEKIEEIVEVAEGEGKEDESILPRLKKLYLQNLPALPYVWKVENQSGCLGNLAHVENIAIKGCQSLEAIFDLVGWGHHEEEAALEINFLSLTSLTLEDLPSFSCIRNSNNNKGLARLPEVGSLYPNSLTVEHSLLFDPKVYFPVLRELRIKGLGNLKEIWNSQLSCQSFQNLTSLKVTGCHSLRYLLSPSIARGLVRLEELNIEDCEKIEEIVEAAEGEEKEDESILPRLKKLYLRNLPALPYVWKVENQSGCLGNLAHVENIAIKGCQSLEAIFDLVGWGHHEEEAALEINFLSLTLEDLPSFSWIRNSNNNKGLARLPEVGSLYPNSLTVEHSLFFDPKVHFPVLRRLRIKGLGNLKEIWNSQLSPNSFCELTNLKVENCDKLLHLVPTHMQNRLQKLEHIWVKNCSSLEEIFEVKRLTVNEGDASTISQSKKIPSSISQPDQGMQINNIMDFKQSHQGFQYLTSLWVTRCASLRYMLSPSIARGLVRLESLSIMDCEKIEEIVAAAEGEEKEDESILPRLKYLELLDLPNLGSFSQGKYTFEWPLVDIDIRRCNKMNNFCSGSLSIPRKAGITVRASGKNLEQELINCRKES